MRASARRETRLAGTEDPATGLVVQGDGRHRARLCRQEHVLWIASRVHDRRLIGELVEAKHGRSRLRALAEAHAREGVDLDSVRHGRVAYPAWCGAGSSSTDASKESSSAIRSSGSPSATASPAGRETHGRALSKPCSKGSPTRSSALSSLRAKGRRTPAWIASRLPTRRPKACAAS